MHSILRRCCAVLLLSLAASSAALAQTRAIQHAMGTAQVPAAPQRVVTLTNESAEALLELGVKPVGIVRTHGGLPAYPHLGQRLAGAKQVGSELDVSLEAIAALRPDLIIANKLRHEKIYPQLAAIAPTVMSETLRGRWQKNFALYAKSVGRDAAGTAKLAQFRVRTQRIGQALGERKKLRISLVRFMADQTRVYHLDTFSGQILAEIGFQRPPAQNVNDFMAKVGRERIGEMDGDLLFYYVFDKGNGAASAVERQWTQDALWKSLKVVRAGQVYRVSDDIWNSAGGIVAANLLLNDIERLFKLKL
jgi:iron complex transport system substrate-binding protein